MVSLDIGGLAVETADKAQMVSGWERVAMAIEKVRERLQRTAQALDAAQVPYAVIGGNAVAEWVGRVDEGAVRFTRVSLVGIVEISLHKRTGAGLDRRGLRLRVPSSSTGPTLAGTLFIGFATVHTSRLRPGPLARNESPGSRWRNSSTPSQ